MSGTVMMTGILPDGWRLARFDEILKRTDRRFVIDDSASYDCVGVRWYGLGAFVREHQLGMDIARKQQWLIRADDVVYNKLFAWKGAFAVADSSVDGCIVSDKFPTYEADRSFVDLRFLSYFFRTRQLARQAEEKSKGAAAISKLTLNPPRFWDLTIPLPPLPEQQRIVARVEALAAKIEEARGLRRAAVEEAAAYVVSAHLQLAESRRVRLHEILSLDEGKQPVVPGERYPQVGIKGFGQGLFRRETLDATQTTYKAFNRLFDGAVVLSQVKGWEGAIAICPAEFDGWYASPEYRTFRCIPGQASPDYLSALVATPWFHDYLKGLTRGVGARRERTRPEAFLRLELPMPTLDQQIGALPIFDKLERLKPLQAETQTELDALMPAVLEQAFRGEL
jgi:type I restriction enzyme S subunit